MEEQQEREALCPLTGHMRHRARPKCGRASPAARTFVRFRAAARARKKKKLDAPVPVAGETCVSPQQQLFLRAETLIERLRLSNIALRHTAQHNQETKHQTSRYSMQPAN